MKIKALLSQRIESAFEVLGLQGQAMLQAASRPEFGDYQANGVMAAAKRSGQNPKEVAAQVIAQLDLKGIAKDVSIAGPGFINITLAEEFLATICNTQPSKTENPLTAVVDYSGPNLAKEMHIGHIRSTIIGDCIARVLEAQGHKVVRQNHVGDWGTQFGMLLTYLNETGENSDALSDIEDFYRAAKQRFDEDEDFKSRSRQTVVALQAGDEQVLSHWHRFIDMSISHCQHLYQRMGVELTRDDIKGESSYNDELAPMIEQLAKANLLTESEGAQCIFLDEFKNKDGDILPLIVRKSDGGYLYATTDMVALQHRTQTLGADRVLYFVDARQSLHFKQIFAAGRAAGLASEHVELSHMQFGTMLGKDNKPFKTRQGALIKLADLLDEAIERSQKVLAEKRGGAPEDMAHLAEVIGIGAVKYADLSKNRTSDYVFDWDQMLSFEGNTSPYLQYAYSRIQSIFSKSDVARDTLPEQITTVDEAERRLAVAIAGFDDMLDLVAKEGYPHYLCGYLYDLAGRFTQFYEQCPILTSADQDKVRRLRLAEQSGEILANGLELLGIGVVERM